MNDQILISCLELSSHIGITAEERAKPQRLTVSLVLHPKHGLANLGDNLENTIDYADVCNRIREFAAGDPVNLIETLAEQIAQMLFAKYPVASLEIELRKYILPETQYVAVKIHREAPAQESLA